ncbi:MAG: hypothetical protein IPO21_04350 [Bacteroidales bacterium]|nr:hypothetical protein [Bacteroidales bacterium]
MSINSINAKYCTSDADVTFTHTGDPARGEWQVVPGGVTGSAVLKPSAYKGSAQTTVNIQLNYTDANGCKPAAVTPVSVQIYDLPTITMSSITGRCSDAAAFDLIDYVAPKAAV